MTNALVPVFSGEIAGQSTHIVNARELWKKLSVKVRFNDWIRRRIEEYEFVEGEDFYSNLSKNTSGRGRPSMEYILSLDMAKELAMIENNENGRNIRRYFIQCERELRETGAGHPQQPALPYHTRRHFIREETATSELISQTLITPELLSQHIDQHHPDYMLIERKWLREHLEWVHEQAAIAASAIQQRNQYMLNKTYHPDPDKALEMRKQNIIAKLGART